MSRYFASAVNGAGNPVSIGGRGGKSAGPVHLRGWDAGVRVVPVEGPGKDSFEVYLTTGSHDTGPARLLGIVRDTENGTVFELATDSAGRIPEWVTVEQGRL